MSRYASVYPLVTTRALARPFTISVITRYPADLDMAYGQDTCRGVAHRLGAWLTRK